MHDPEHRLLRYYIACLEAERMRELELSPEDEGRQFVLLQDGEERLVTGEETSVEISEPRIVRWLGRRLLAGQAEQVFVGYPVVLGERERDEKAVTLMSPLFFVPVEVERVVSGALRVLPETSLPELNVFALELLGLSREERIGLVAAAEEMEEIQSAPTARARIEAWLRFLADEGLVGEDFRLEPERLSHLQRGVSNTAVFYAAERGPVIRNLVEDLEELCRLPVARLRQGPLGVLLGAVAAPSPPPGAPQPAVVPTNIAQDRAVTAALSCPFTVVTGPPGTGKSQVLVNAVAASTIRGERVLFASKNNQAVDVVFERLAQVSAEAAPVRAGAARYRGDVALQLQRALARPPRWADLGPAYEAWRRVERDLAPVYEAARRREETDAELRWEERQYEQMLRAAPPATLALAEPEPVIDAARRVLALIPVATRPRPWWPWARRRWQRAVEELRAQWESLRRLVGGAVTLPGEPDAEAAEGCLALAEIAGRIAGQRARVEALQRRLEGLPDAWELHDRLQELATARMEAARRLFDATWRRLLGETPPEKRARAGAFAEGLARASTGDRPSVRRLLQLVPDVLHVFPIWGLTNLSARTNLPLEPGLFDLVIIDEASQCDIPSAIPLLYRAKRALIIGDPKQLIHVTSLGEWAEDRIATRHGLTDEERITFSYRTRSLFGLASARVGETPLFLDQHFRCHPAIITFSNDHFYGSRLVILSDPSRGLAGPAVRWVHVPGEFRRGPRGRSAVNPPEAEAVVRELLALSGEFRRRRLTIGVVTPYRAHAELVRELVLQRLPELAEGLVVATAHRFQGDERDVIVFSPVLSAQTPDYHLAFVSDPNLVNVAVTRARLRLVIVGDRKACLNSPGVLRELAQYVLDLESGGFRSPLERRLYEALRAAGIEVEVGVETEGYRLDLAVCRGTHRIDVECDGAAFHRDQRAHAIRDERLRRAGWEVVRFSGRDIQRDLARCVQRVIGLLQ
ncbi:MAG: AAA domain-containing protein [Armatimonadota bacterium]|nr:AAA domain-containing protein [Armatimonadota bacterium]